MKKVPYTILLFLISLQGFTQINNLTDLLDVSKLTLQEMVSELQYTWETQQPEQIITEKGFVTERYKFIYKQENAKQILQRSCRMELQTTLTFCITNFIFSDKTLLDRIVTNLKYNGYELKGTQGKQSMYEDGNNIITVDTNFKNVNGVIVYNIGVVIGSKNSNVNPDIKTETKAPKKEDRGETALKTILKGREEFKDPYKTDITNDIKFTTSKTIKEVGKILTDKYNFGITYTENGLYGYSNKESCIAVRAEVKDKKTFVEYSWECD